MEVLIQDQLLTMLLSIVLGVFVGAIYDVFKIFRILSGLEFSNRLQNKISKINLPLIKKIKAKKNNKIKKYILYIIWDLLFCFSIIPIMQIFVYATSSGVVRWYIFLGTFIGFIAYYFTLSKIIVPIYEYILLFLKIIFAYIFYFIGIPLKKLIAIYKNKVNKYKIKREKQLEKKKIKERESMRNIIIYNGNTNKNHHPC